MISTKPLTRGSSETAIRRRLFRHVDISSLVFFRIAFGLIMAWEVARYFLHGWIKRYFIDPEFYFTFWGFDWVRPWAGNGMYLHFLVLGLLALFIAAGFMYRLSMTLFFLGFTYIFLLDKSNYLNHFYLISLVSFLMIFIPCHRALSLDAKFQPSMGSQSAPAWALWTLRAQIGLVYLFGGIAKLNGDWLRGEPMRNWLANSTDFPLIGPLFTEEWMVSLMTYGGLLLDLFVVPLLILKKTRPLALAATVVFHLLNSRLFEIGIFPWFMIAATLLFLDPDWPRSFLERPKVRMPARVSAQNAGWATVGLLSVYFAVQMLVPLRHFAIPGDVNWTEEGHRFSWHMKLRDKSATASFTAFNPEDGQSFAVDPDIYLTDRQLNKMSARPDMIIQFAHYLSEVLTEPGNSPVEIRASVDASLNSRERQLLVDPTVNLAAQPRLAFSSTWIVPLET